MEKLCDLLKIEKGVTAIIGGGGKTTMLRVLGEELSAKGTVILTTSTKIFPFEDIPFTAWETGAYEERGSEYEEEYCRHITKSLRSSYCICTGTPLETSKISAPELPFEKLAELADYIIVEADGSKGLPVKAHESWEPVIPECANKTVLLMGLWCFGKPALEVVHRPHIFCRFADCTARDTVIPASAAKLIRGEDLADALFLNGLTEENLPGALMVKSMLDMPVFAGNLQQKQWFEF